MNRLNKYRTRKKFKKASVRGFTEQEIKTIVEFIKGIPKNVHEYPITIDLNGGLRENLK